MKKILLQLLFLPVVSTLIYSCKKESPASPPPDGTAAVLTTEGFFCTTGVGFSGYEDTLAYNPWGGGPVTEYSSGNQDYDDKLLLTSNSDGSVTLQRRVPYTGNNQSFQFFGCQQNTNPAFSIFPENEYLFYLNDVKSSETKLTIKRSDDDKNKFTLELTEHPGNYLNTKKWANASYPVETELVFGSEHQLFFFMAQ